MKNIFQDYDLLLVTWIDVRPYISLAKNRGGRVGVKEKEKEGGHNTDSVQINFCLNAEINYDIEQKMSNWYCQLALT